MNQFNLFKNTFPLAGLALLATLFLVSGSVSAQGYLLGDVNGDGVINVLDVQATVSQALGAAAATVEANVDENAQVDILDVQNLINTVLGTGGLVQTVLADISHSPLLKEEGEQRVIAVSNEGLFAEGAVDPETGMVQLNLRVKSGWALALMVKAGEGPETVVGTIDFPIQDTVSATLPLPALSRGVALDLGTLHFGGPAKVNDRAQVARDIRELMGDISAPVDTADNNGNGLPDFIEPLLAHVRNRL